MKTFVSSTALLLVLTAGTAAHAHTIELTGTVRDFKADQRDFEGPRSTGVQTGCVQNTLGAKRVPVATNVAQSKCAIHNLPDWYTDNQRNRAMPITITLDNGKNAPGGIYRYENTKFFPIDGKLFGNQGRGHNYHFTYAIHYTFAYTGNETFTFKGDDDVWVFINNELVVDLGGLHRAATQEVTSAQLAALGLKKGQVYPFDFFFAERHTTQSNFIIETSMILQPPPNLTVKKVGNGKGTIKSTPPGIDCGTDCTESYPKGERVTLRATPALNSRFVGWRGDCMGSRPSTTVLLNAAKTCQAKFKKRSPPKFTLSVKNVGNGKGVVRSTPPGIDCGMDCKESYTKGKRVTLTATPDSNSLFGGWTGACKGSNLKTTVLLNAAKTCKATFDKIKGCSPQFDIGMTFNAKFPDREGKYYIIPAEVVDAIIKAINTGTILVIDKPPVCQLPIE